MSETVWSLVVLSFAFGAAFGAWTANRRWRGNATDYKRIASGGRLYRTVDVTQWSPERDANWDEMVKHIAAALQAADRAGYERGLREAWTEAAEIAEANEESDAARDRSRRG